jgi:hypothetical protein
MLCAGSSLEDVPVYREIPVAIRSSCDDDVLAAVQHSARCYSIYEPAVTNWTLTVVAEPPDLTLLMLKLTILTRFQTPCIFESAISKVHLIVLLHLILGLPNDRFLRVWPSECITRPLSSLHHSLSFILFCSVSCHGLVDLCKSQSSWLYEVISCALTVVILGQYFSR